MKKVFIELKSLHKSFGEQLVLDDLSLEIYGGEIFSLIGASGGGKSVILQHILGLLNPDKGEVFIDGVDISKLKEREKFEHRKKIGILFQHGALFDSMSVWENIAFPLVEAGEKDRNVLNKKVMEVLDLVELEQHADKMPSFLSGGMRKRVALARAVINKPKCVLYDEPTAGLDPIATANINNLITKLSDEFGNTSVVISHDMQSVFDISDRIGFIRKGKKYFVGVVQDLKNSEDNIISNFVNGVSAEEEVYY